MKKANERHVTLGSATHAAKRAADIVFVLQNKERLERRAVITRLNAVLGEYDEQNADVAYSDLGGLTAVSERLYGVFATTDTKIAASLLNGILTEYAHPPRLSAHGKTLWHLHVDSGDDASWAEWFAASSALALATLLAEKQRNPAGLCASLSCRRPFIDSGKGGGRSYCSPRCATRERVAAYRSKAKA